MLLVVVERQGERVSRAAGRIVNARRCTDHSTPHKRAPSANHENAPRMRTCFNPYAARATPPATASPTGSPAARPLVLAAGLDAATSAIVAVAFLDTTRATGRWPACTTDSGTVLLLHRKPRRGLAPCSCIVFCLWQPAV